MPELGTALYLRSVPPQPGEARRAYAGRLREEAHRLLDTALADAGAPRGPLAAGPHGKPYLPGGEARFNLTHCRGLAACAVGQIECGVDAEPLGREPGAALRRVCAPAERLFVESAPDPGFAFFRLWTLKESFVKAIGTGLSYPLQDAAFTPEGDGLRFCLTGFAFRQLVTAEHIISVCALREGAQMAVLPEPLMFHGGDLVLDVKF